MNILKDNLSGTATKRAYMAPAMELIVMNHHTDLLQGSPNASDNITQGSIGIEEE